ncbi:aromatic-ring-hydroxylating dioxygenase subunit beta [Amorphus sp. MBR-141]
MTKHEDRSLMEVSLADQQRLIDFLNLEAKYADEARYDEWDGLLESDMFYWVPAGDTKQPDPETTVSVIADNRPRLKNRIAQLKTGLRLAQQPASPMRRQLSNFEFKSLNEHEFCVECNFALFEYRIQATREMTIWAGRYEYRLRRRDYSFGMFYKRVELTNASDPLPTLAFLI